jgi:hypothetical protein
MPSLKKIQAKRIEKESVHSFKEEIHSTPKSEIRYKSSVTPDHKLFIRILSLPLYLYIHE